MGDRGLRNDSREVRWGILGAGRISHRFASSLKKVDGARLVAAAGRTPAHVEEFCRAFSIDAAHGHASVDDNGNVAYDALIADPDVDAIYLALPHGMHTRWACRALCAGKAVLCEKPAVLSEEEALSIASTSRERGVLFMEAMKNRFCPMRTRVKDFLASGELGRIVSIESVQKLDYGESPSGFCLIRCRAAVYMTWAVMRSVGLRICSRARARFRPVKFAGVTYQAAAWIGPMRSI